MVKNIILDGRTNGVAIFLSGKNEILMYKTKDQELVPKLFRSVKLAKIYLKNEFNIVSPKDYYLLFVIEGQRFDYEKSGYYNDHYIIYDDKSDDIIRYNIYEEVNDKIIALGYLSFYNAENNDEIEKEEKQRVQKNIFRQTRNALQELLIRNNKQYEKIYKDANGHLCLNLKHSSGAIHICFNNQLIKLNQKRKEQGIRCYPFEKNINGYSSLYCYLTKDVFEPDKFETAEKLKISIDNLIEILNEIEPESNPHFIPVDFKGEIRL